MTSREKVLAAINNELETTHWEAWHEGARALLAVMELHKPYESTDSGLLCSFDKGVHYPCPTVEAIEKELAR